jgi:hypothetical protein
VDVPARVWVAMEMDSGSGLTVTGVEVGSGSKAAGVTKDNDGVPGPVVAGVTV